MSPETRCQWRKVSGSANGVNFIVNTEKTKGQVEVLVLCVRNNGDIGVTDLFTDRVSTLSCIYTQLNYLSQRLLV